MTALVTSTARAEDDSTTTAPKPSAEPETTWYGAQTLAADGAAIALALVGGAASRSQGISNTLLTASVAAYGLGAPIVHIAHGRGGVAAGDLLLRIGAPFLGGLFGALMGGAAWGQSSYCGDGGSCGALVGGMFGLGAGMLTASIVDAAALAYEPAAPHDASAKQQIGVRVAPSFAPGGVGAIGTF